MRRENERVISEIIIDILSQIDLTRKKLKSIEANLDNIEFDLKSIVEEFKIIKEDERCC